MLKVVTPAADPALISIEAMRLVAGVAAGDSSRDAELQALAERLSAEVANACRVAVASGGNPTLRRETLEETFRYPRTSALMLSRRHEVEIGSITLSGQSLPSASYWIEEESGIVRLVSGAYWNAATTVVTYSAGFDDVPPDLWGAVADFARIRLAETARDPLVKGESTEVPGVMTQRTDYWVGAVPGSSKGGVPAAISAQLRRYKNLAFA